ncbi:hypothetical protein CEXT_735701, partial [Caerostris extrusa]
SSSLPLESSSLSLSQNLEGFDLEKRA